MLEFLKDLPQYNPYTDSICLFAVDGEIVVVFHILRSALEYIENSSALDDQHLLPAFYRHFILIQEVAAERHRAHRAGKREVSYTLTPDDFAQRDKSR